MYDTGALVAAERRDRKVWHLHATALESGTRPIVPVVVLAQAWRGGPQVDVSRFLRGCDTRPASEEAGRAAGALCGRAGTSDVVDALVVVMAMQLRAPVVTSDPEDLGHLASAAGAKIRLHVV